MPARKKCQSHHSVVYPEKTDSPDGRARRRWKTRQSKFKPVRRGGVDGNGVNGVDRPCIIVVKLVENGVKTTNRIPFRSNVVLTNVKYALTIAGSQPMVHANITYKIEMSDLT